MMEKKAGETLESEEMRWSRELTSSHCWTVRRIFSARTECTLTVIDPAAIESVFMRRNLQNTGPEPSR